MVHRCLQEFPHPRSLPFSTIIHFEWFLIFKVFKPQAAQPSLNFLSFSLRLENHEFQDLGSLEEKGVGWELERLEHFGCFVSEEPQLFNI
jgi:hypothetical protein